MVKSRSQISYSQGQSERNRQSYNHSSPSGPPQTTNLRHQKWESCPAFNWEYFNCRGESHTSTMFRSKKKVNLLEEIIQKHTDNKEIHENCHFIKLISNCVVSQRFKGQSKLSEIISYEVLDLSMNGNSPNPTILRSDINYYPLNVN